MGEKQDLEKDMNSLKTDRDGKIKEIEKEKEEVDKRLKPVKERSKKILDTVNKVDAELETAQKEYKDLKDCLDKDANFLAELVEEAESLANKMESGQKELDIISEEVLRFKEQL